MMYKILGITDEVTTCTCCGRKNLKRTVVLDHEGGTEYFGTSCATTALGYRKETKLKNEVASIVYKQVYEATNGDWRAADRAIAWNR